MSTENPTPAPERIGLPIEFLAELLVQSVKRAIEVGTEMGHEAAEKEFRAALAEMQPEAPDRPVQGDTAVNPPIGASSPDEDSIFLGDDGR